MSKKNKEEIVVVDGHEYVPLNQVAKISLVKREKEQIEATFEDEKTARFRDEVREWYREHGLKEEFIDQHSLTYSLVNEDGIDKFILPIFLVPIDEIDALMQELEQLGFWKVELEIMKPELLDKINFPIISQGIVAVLSEIVTVE